MGPLAELLGESPGIVTVRETIGRLLQRHSDARRLPPILIHGETGTGKGLLARAIHRAGPRASEPFVDVNCAAIPETLVEAELFGFERGAFTDARQAKAGLFQAAHRGTIFLDEVGLLPVGLQGKLLTVIEERTVRRLGSTRSEPVDAWIMAATSADLDAETRARRFREDLYHRLAVLTLQLPPLRERGQDILLLAEQFLAQACADYNVPPKRLAPDARAGLLAYPWPGNVRELANAMERVALLLEEPVVTAEMLGLPTPPSAERAEALPREHPLPLKDAVESLEQEHLIRALHETTWNLSRAAARLGIARNTLRYRIKKHGLQPGVFPQSPRPPAEPVEAPKTTLAAAVPGAGVRPAGLRWERRRLTLLRAGLVVPATVDAPRETSRPVEVLAEKVESFGGRVEELSPTGILGVFGLEPVEDAARRAALSAIAIRTASERGSRGEAGRIAVKLGIHTAQVMVGEGGSAAVLDLETKRQAGTVLEALVAQAEADSILVSAGAAPFLERRFDLVPLEGVEGAPGQVYRLSRRERIGLGLGRRMAGFVGRHEELELLQRRFAMAAQGQGHVMGIVGEAGIGKSRLLFEFRHSQRGKAITYLEGRCFSYGSAIPYFPLLDILRRNFGITETDHPEAVTEKVRTGLGQLEMDPEEWAPYILQLLGVKEGMDRLAALSPEVIKGRTFETLRQLCLQGSRQRPIVLVLEDLNWIDKTSEDCVAWLVERLAGTPILFLCTYRPGYRPPWMDKSYATQVALLPLSREQSLSLVQSSLQMEQVPEPLLQLILAKAEGNPFFLEELTRALWEEDDLRPSEAVPETIEEVLLARIHRLPDEPKRLLQTASVLGREFSLRLLDAIWEWSGNLEPHLHELVRLEFLYEKAKTVAPVYVFKHPLTHEVAYGSLPAPRRKALHAAAGRALEHLYATRPEEVHDYLAYHYSKADEASKAIEYLTRVAAKAARAHAPVEAVQALEEAFVHVERLPEEEQEKQILDLILRQGSSLIALGHIQEIRDLLLRRQETLERIADPARIGRYYFLLGRTYSFLGDHERVEQCVNRAIEEAGRSGDLVTMGKAYCLLALDDPMLGQALQGIEHARQAAALLEGTKERWWLGQAYWLMGLNQAQLGQFDAALEAEAQARAIGEAIKDSALLTFADSASGVISVAVGEREEGIKACQRALERSPDPLNTAICMGWLGFAHLEKGDPAAAIPLLEPSVQQLVRFGFRQFQGWFTIILSECYLLTGQVEKAHTLATRGLELAREARYRYVVGWAQRALGRIFKASGALSEAEIHLKEALLTFDSIQARYDVGRTHLDMAALAQAQGIREAAKTHLKEARRLFELLRVPNYVERTEQLGKDLGVYS